MKIMIPPHCRKTRQPFANTTVSEELNLTASDLNTGTARFANACDELGLPIHENSSEPYRLIHLQAPAPCHGSSNTIPYGVSPAVEVKPEAPMKGELIWSRIWVSPPFFHDSQCVAWLDSKCWKLLPFGR
jgi:hypothetical protein